MVTRNRRQEIISANLPKQLFLGWFSLFILFFVFSLVFYGFNEYQNFKRVTEKAADRTLSTSIRQISQAIDNYHRSLELFLADERENIGQMADPNNTEKRSDMGKHLDTKLALLFSGPFDFYVTDSQGRVFFTDDDSWHEETQKGFLPTCETNTKPVEITAQWGSQDSYGYFIVCESLFFIQDILVDNAITGINFSIISLSTNQAIYTHPRHPTDSSVDNAPHNTMPMPGGAWLLGTKINQEVYANKLDNIIGRCLLVMLAFIIFCAFLWFTLIRSERKRRSIEKQWRDLQDRAEVTLASIGDGVVVTDMLLNVQYINPKARAMLDVTDEILGQALSEICPIHKALLKHVRELSLNSVLPNDRFQISLEQNGRHIHLEQSVNLLSHADDQNVGLVWVLRDVTEHQANLEALAKSEKQYRLLTENVDDVIWTMDLNMRLNYISPSAAFLFRKDPAEIMHEGFELILGKKHSSTLAHYCQKMIDGEQEQYGLELDLGKKNQPLWLEIRCSLLRDRSDTPVGLLGIIRDITERRLSEAELHLSAIVFDNSFEGILITNEKGNILRVNKAFSKITGYLPDDVLGKNAKMLQSGRHSKDYYREMWESLKESGYWHGEIWNRRRNGEIYPQRLSISAIKEDNRPEKYIGIFADITDKKESEERIHRLAYFDELSELPNRVLFQERLKRAMVQARRNNQWVGLLFIDLDRFKTVNDTLGHPAGDKLLKITAQRLRTCLREEDTVARMGGDEFTLILVGMNPGESAEKGAEKVARKVLEVVSEPYELEGREVFVGASIGIAFYPKDGTQLIEILKNADMALYHAKAQGRNNFQYYSEEMNSEIMDRLELENDLRRAIKSDEFKIYYQPQVSVESGELCGIEALIRWYSPTRGLVSPHTFIPVAEDTGMILTLGEWSLNVACKKAVYWLEKGYHMPKLAVNLSARQFAQPELVGIVKDVLNKTGLPPELLELELTESVLMDDIDGTIETLKELKSMGALISIDDFGTGYSSLNYLKRFPIDRLKIDQSFVRDITVDPDDAEVIAAIIAIAHNLKLDVIAEGVETWGQLEFLRFHKCNHVQGFLISRPLTEEDMTELLKSGEVEYLYKKFV